MNLRKILTTLILFIGLLNVNSSFLASETETSSEDTRFEPEASLEQSVKKAVTGTNFNGSIMLSQNNNDEYNVLYEGAAGDNGGYTIDTVYDIGSVSKLYTTTAIMLLQEQGKLSYADSISKYIDNVPDDKKSVTIKMLLTHSSGIYAAENDNHNVSKDDEVARILKSKLSFKPGTNFKYSNAGFTLLAVIIEAASGESYEDFLTNNIFEPLDLEHTGFPNSRYLKDLPAVSGTLDGVSYGKVTNFDFGWYSKGYSDVLTTPRELTYFFQALIGGKIISKDNLSLMNLNEIDLGANAYRGYGTDIKHYKTKQAIVGHTGIWYGGNSAVYYRPSDKMLFVITCDQLNVTSDLPANYVFNTLNAMYPSGKLKDADVVETTELNDLMVLTPSDLSFDVDVSTDNSNQLTGSLTKANTISGLKYDIKRIVNYALNHPKLVIAILSILFIIVLIILLNRIRTKSKQKRKKRNVNHEKRKHR